VNVVIFGLKFAVVVGILERRTISKFWQSSNFQLQYRSYTTHSHLPPDRQIMIVLTLILFIPFVFGEVSVVNHDGTSSLSTSSTPGINLGKLPYEYNALEPYLNEQTLRIHHDKHHAKVWYTHTLFSLLNSDLASMSQLPIQ
jgi:hypothetical protein